MLHQSEVRGTIGISEATFAPTPSSFRADAVVLIVPPIGISSLFRNTRVPQQKPAH